jgi:hypothetical protein
MKHTTDKDAVAAALEEINRAWLEGRPKDLAPRVHPAVVMAPPGFAGRVEGRDAFVAGFVDFCENADLREYAESGHQVDVTGDTAVATYTFEMVYERSGATCRSTGRDLWVFARQGDAWRAVWRTMLDLAERPA